MFFAGPLSCGRIGYDLETKPSGGVAGARDAAPDDGAAATVDAWSPGSGGYEAGAPSSGGARGVRDAALDVADAAGDAGHSRSDGSSRDLDARASLDGASDAACVPAGPAPDCCTLVPKLPAPPVIDGVLDCGLELRTLAPAGWNGTDPLPPSNTAEFAVGYRPDGLYFFVHVTDPNRVPPKIGDEAWRGDGVEMYVDTDGVFAAAPAFDDPGTRQVQVAAPIDSLTSSTRGELYTCGNTGSRVAWTAPRFIAVPTPDGYDVEAFVTAEEIGVASWTLAPGSRVGMDLGVNVSDPDTSTYEAADGYRAGQYFVRVANADAGLPGPFQNVAAFCTPLLGQ